MPSKYEKAMQPTHKSVLISSFSFCRFESVPALLLPYNVQGVVRPVHELRIMVRQICVCRLQGYKYRHQMTKTALLLYRVSDCICLSRPSS